MLLYSKKKESYNVEDCISIIDIILDSNLYTTYCNFTYFVQNQDIIYEITSIMQIYICRLHKNRLQGKTERI